MRRRFTGARGADLAALLFALALAIFGARFHRVEESGTAERDGYVSRAEQLLAGEIPRDPFRPLLYPILIAALASFGLSPFVAARLLSNVAAALLARSAYALGRRLDPRDSPPEGPSSAGAWAMALTMVNPKVWTEGQHATTDMCFAAVAAGFLVLLVDFSRQPDRRKALLLGALLGTAAFLRATAHFLVPGLFFGLLLAATPWRRKAAYLACVAGVALLVLLPHFVLRAEVFGDPIHDENWKNLAFKLYANGDWSYFDRVPFDSLGAVIAHDPGRFLRGGLAGLVDFARKAPTLIFGTPALALLVLAGLAWLLVVERSRAAALLAVSGAVYLFALALLFVIWSRFLILAIPIGSAFAAAGVTAVRRQFAGSRLGAGLAFATLAGSVALLSATTLFFRLPSFVSRHPTMEIAALRGISGLPPGTALAGTAPFLGRYLDGPYVELPDAFGVERSEPCRYFERLERLLVERNVRYVVVSALELADRPHELLGPSAPVPWLRLRRSLAGGALWEVDPEAGTGCHV